MHDEGTLVNLNHHQTSVAGAFMNNVRVLRHVLWPPVI